VAHKEVSPYRRACTYLINSLSRSRLIGIAAATNVMYCFTSSPPGAKASRSLAQSRLSRPSQAASWFIVQPFAICTESGSSRY